MTDERLAELSRSFAALAVTRPHLAHGRAGCELVDEVLRLRRLLAAPTPYPAGLERASAYGVPSASGRPAPAENDR